VTTLSEATERWCERYQRHSMMRVTADLATPVSYVEPIHLDAVLAWVMVWRILHGRSDVEDVIDDVSIPVARATVHGCPVWEATSLFPATEIDPEIVRYRKRPPEPELIEWGEPCKLRMKQGRFRAYDIPLLVRPVRSLSGLVHGSEAGVRKLLEHVSHVGKKRSQGYGRVLRWSVEPVEIDEFPWRMANGGPSRVIPVAEPLGLQGYRPPYWHREWWVPCVAP
jgi:hypothetical protein